MENTIMENLHIGQGIDIMALRKSYAKDVIDTTYQKHKASLERELCKYKNQIKCLQLNQASVAVDPSYSHKDVNLVGEFDTAFSIMKSIKSAEESLVALEETYALFKMA